CRSWMAGTASSSASCARRTCARTSPAPRARTASPTNNCARHKLRGEEEGACVALESAPRAFAFAGARCREGDAAQQRLERGDARFGGLVVGRVHELRPGIAADAHARLRMVDAAAADAPPHLDPLDFFHGGLRRSPANSWPQPMPASRAPFDSGQRRAHKDAYDLHL